MLDSTKSLDSTNSLNPKILKSEKSILKIHAHALGLPAGSAEIFIDKSLLSASKSLKNHKNITDSSFRRAVLKELKKYNSDLAYLYENYQKII